MPLRIGLQLVNKEDQERLALDRFREASGLLSGEVKRGADPPDFLIMDGDRRVAVEMTRYHQESGRKGSPAAAREALEMRFAAHAKAIFEATHPGVYLVVRPHFVHGALNLRNLKEHATRFAQAVAGMIPPTPSELEPGTSRQASWQELEDAGLGAVLTMLDLWRSLSLPRNDWEVGTGGYVSADTRDLESVIRKKESDLHSYAKKADECWLVVYAMPQASAFFDFEVLTPHMWKSAFDRVAFIDLFLARFVMVA